MAKYRRKIPLSMLRIFIRQKLSIVILKRECLWKNAPSDGLLDTSDFWYFKKTDNKILPVQIQPGRADIPQGSHLVLAGNTSSTADSAVIVSAPVACQRSPGNLTFHYWLYNQGKIEVIVMSCHTQEEGVYRTLFRPKISCHILRTRVMISVQYTFQLLRNRSD
ncbi:hypothetical protein KIN20_036998 [Parelaphostrongylus tenuis]|uniref:Uncharacterized protein n=1 Tax=Parelaphostrongylus tenuis TaxID=148309 RepID=A0AAD5WKZ6_PARTN|nr:hypothetical protein KIN20_036998 [Parelaphostrongylus tenuis]